MSNHKNFQPPSLIGTPSTSQLKNTKDFAKNTKEKSNNYKFHIFSIIVNAKNNLRHMAAFLRSEPLVAPIIGVRLRYRSKWEICSDLAPIRSVLVKHKGYLWKKSEPMILWYLSANI